VDEALTPTLWRSLATLVLASLVVMGSPGPATMSVTALGASFGFRRSVPYLAGIVLGTTAVLLAVAAGLVSMLLSAPRLAPVLLALSAGYIVYLAFRIATAPPLSRQEGKRGRRHFPAGSCSRSPIPRPISRSRRSSPARGCRSARRWPRPP
jgi:threonine/homoserine/homoserine lactone efflux protein